jgi:hypothetical protein
VGIAGVAVVQVTQNGEVHDWYRIGFGFDEQIVAQILDEFGARRSWTVIDPFCGTGTTLVECKKRAIRSVGIDANPSSILASRVKTRWDLRPARLKDLAAAAVPIFRRGLRGRAAVLGDPTYRYLESSGMLLRGWISPDPLFKAISLKHAIYGLSAPRKYAQALLLCLISEVVYGSSNVKFGPELYCASPRSDCDVLGGFLNRVDTVASDLETVSQLERRPTYVVRGDSRNCLALNRAFIPRHFDALICSPPYPTEHDYTRNSRLELAFIESVTDVETLRRIKRTMIRSHSKGIYKGDDDAAFVADCRMLRPILAELRVRAAKKDYKFAPLYPRVVQEYFGGMHRHLSSMLSRLRPGARCAYIVGDQMYLQVHVPTARILASIAREVGYEEMGRRVWRQRTPTTRRSSPLDETIVFLRRPT